MERPVDSALAATGSFEERWRERFREFAESHDDEAGIAGWSSSGLGARLRRFSGLWAGSRPRGRWLDAGCGAGSYVRLLEGAGHEVVGVDYSLVTLRKALARGRGTCHYLVADVRNLPFRGGDFDGVLCFGVMQALAGSEPALRELADNVRTGGELWVDALNRWCVVNGARVIARRIAGQPMHLRYESPWKIRRMLRRFGFDEVEVHWMPIAPAGWPGLQRWLERPSIRRIFAIVPLLGLLASHGFIVRARNGRVARPATSA